MRGDTAGRSAAPAAGPRPVSVRPASRPVPAAAAGGAAVGGIAGGSERGVAGSPPASQCSQCLDSGIK